MRSRLGYIIATAVLIVLFSWLTYTTFWILHSFSYWGMIKYMHDVFTLPAYLTFSFGLVGREIAALLSIVAVGIFMTKGWTSRTAKLVLAAAVLEGAYLMTYLPAGGVGPQTNDWITALEATPSAIVEAIIVPIPLFILAYKLWRTPNSHGDLLKWASIAGVGYFFVFWFKFTMQWLATFFATAADWTFFNPGAGFGYVLNYPLNMLEFLLTSVGLFIPSASVALVCFAVDS